MIAFIQLKQLNKLGGVIFGLIKVLLFLLAGVYFFEKWDETNLILSQETKESSILYPVMSKASNILLPELNNSKILEIPASLKQENNLNMLVIQSKTNKKPGKPFENVGFRFKMVKKTGNHLNM